jgi:hypothetical protein
LKNDCDIGLKKQGLFCPPVVISPPRANSGDPLPQQNSFGGRLFGVLNNLPFLIFYTKPHPFSSQTIELEATGPNKNHKQLREQQLKEPG